jgi:hypothetical protein
VIGFTSAFRGCIPVLALRLPSKPLRSLPSIQEPRYACSPPSSPRLAHLALPSTRILTSPSSHPHLALNSHLTSPLISLITSCRANLALDPHRDDLAVLQEPRGRANHALDPQHDDLAVEQQPRANLAPTSSKNPGKIHLLLAASPLPRPFSPLPRPSSYLPCPSPPQPRPSSPLPRPSPRALSPTSPMPRPSPSPLLASNPPPRPSEFLTSPPRADPHRSKILAAVHSSFLAPLAVGSDGSSPATRLLECCKGFFIFHFEFPSSTNPNCICRTSWPEWGSLPRLKLKENVTLKIKKIETQPRLLIRSSAIQR